MYICKIRKNMILTVFALIIFLLSNHGYCSHDNYKFAFLTGGVDTATPDCGIDLQTEITPTIGLGYSFNNRNSMTVFYGEHEYDSDFFDLASSVNPLKSITDINPAVNVNLLYSKTTENYKDKEVFLEYKYYFQGRENLFDDMKKNMSNSKNAYPFLGLGIGRAEVGYDINYKMSTGQILLSQTHEESMITFHTIIGADLKLGKKWLLTLQGEYVFGEESYAYSSGDIKVDTDKVTSLTDAQRQAIAINRADELNKKYPELEISEARFNLRFSYLF